MRLQSILLPSPGSDGIRDLYFHTEGSWLNFDGYFNLFQIEKRRRYTNIKKLVLHLELCGFSEIRLMNNRDCIKRLPLQAAKKRPYEFELPYTDAKGVFWFSLRQAPRAALTHEELSASVSGYFDGISDAEACVNIAVTICTYRREAYVCRNLKTLFARIYEDRELKAAEHLKVFVIDNGQTLPHSPDFQELLREHPDEICLHGAETEAALTAEPLIQIYPNKNAGGAGGFTRGMIEALGQRQINRFTHVLLMDDDATFEPDSFVRVYGLLSTLRDAYKDITVGGAMLMEEFPWLLYASGEYFENCSIHTPDQGLNLKEYSSCTAPLQLSVENEDRFYCGWWFCCYPLSTVRADNLPLPLFIHFDDIEYGLRAQKNKTVFLNGVNVWHRGLQTSLVGANLYYDVRNNLITTVLHGEGNIQWQIQRYLFKMITASIIRLKYQDLALIYRGVKDFLRGPEWLAQQDPVQLHGKLRKMAYTPRPLEEWRGSLTSPEYAEAERQLHFLSERTGAGQFAQPGRRRNGHWKEKITYNGWLLPHDREPIHVMTTLDSPFDAYRKKKVFLYEPSSRKGLVLTRDYRRLLKSLRYYLRISCLLKQRLSETVKKYRNGISLLSSINTWKKYLDL